MTDYPYKEMHGHVFYRRMGHARPMLSHAEDIYLIDTDERGLIIYPSSGNVDGRPAAHDILKAEDRGGDMQAFEISEVMAAQEAAGQAYLEFLREPELSLGLYHLPAGGVDPQKPHTEDEVYFVLSGRAVPRVSEEDRAVQPGTVVFVEAGVDHQFHSIEEDLKVLVIFAPAEFSRAADHSQE